MAKIYFSYIYIYIYLVFVQDIWFIAAKTLEISYDKSYKDIFLLYCYVN